MEVPVTYKTILVHCDGSNATRHRVGVAADLARRCDGHLVGFHARQPFTAPMVFDAGTFATEQLYEAYMTQMQADERDAAASFRDAVRGRGLTVEWRCVDGFTDEQLAVNARYADLVVVGQTDPSDPRSGTPVDLPEATALATGRPTLVVPYIGAAKPLDVVLLCWNASREAAHAATAALPLLAAASQVVVLVVDAKTSEKGHGPEPGADVATWLSRHGVKVTVQRDVAADTDVGGLILSRAADHGAGLIVMGVYGHSRLRELVLGGASRTLLSGMTVPVFMAH
jgi:nucleotide-binding universal stress UspA family protein